MEIEFPSKLKALLTEKYRYRVLYGGRGGLKSWGAADALLLLGAQKPLRILCTREFQVSIKDSVHQLLRDQIKRLGLDSFYEVQNSQIIGKNGTTFGFIGLRHNTANLKSWEGADICWVEEAQTVSKNSWDILVPTIRKEGSEIWITFNPDLEDDETYQRFVVNPPTNALVIKTGWQDNKWFPAVLEQERQDLLKRDPVAYQNVWEGHCKQAVEGAIYAMQLQKAKDEGRIGHFPYDSRYPVSAFADIGWADNTSIWFLQFVNHQPRVIDCYQNQFQKTPHYVNVLQQRGYNYDRIVLPHDAANEHANADRTWLQIFQSAFPSVKVYAGKRQAIELRLEATKNMFDQLQIDKEHCADGLSALAHYHFAIDPESKRQTREPFHGPESNYADAFGYMCLEMVEARRPVIARQRNMPRWMAASGIRV